MPLFTFQYRPEKVPSAQAYAFGLLMKRTVAQILTGEDVEVLGGAYPEVCHGAPDLDAYLQYGRHILSHLEFSNVKSMRERNFPVMVSSERRQQLQERARREMTADLTSEVENRVAEGMGIALLKSGLVEVRATLTCEPKDWSFREVTIPTNVA